MPSFRVTVPDIHQGTAFLWYGVQVPVSGARLLVDANGNPIGGSPVPMGASDGAATFHIEAKIEEVAIDQETAPVDAKRRSFTPFTCIASSTLHVAMTSLSRSMRCLVNPDGMSVLAPRCQTMSCPFIAPVKNSRSSRSC